MAAGGGGDKLATRRVSRAVHKRRRTGPLALGAPGAKASGRGVAVMK